MVARFLFLPFSIAASLVAGVLATKVFDRLWMLIAREEEPPGADDPEASVGRVVLATGLQATVFAVTRTLFDRGARRWFQHLLGTYPAAK
jgi:hypothetical protein